MSTEHDYWLVQCRKRLTEALADVEAGNEPSLVGLEHLGLLYEGSESHPETWPEVDNMINQFRSCPELVERLPEAVDILVEEAESARGSMLASAIMAAQGGISMWVVCARAYDDHLAPDEVIEGRPWTPYVRRLDALAEGRTHEECCAIAALRDAWGITSTSLDPWVSHLVSAPMGSSPVIDRLLGHLF